MICIVNFFCRLKSFYVSSQDERSYPALRYIFALLLILAAIIEWQTGVLKSDYFQDESIKILDIYRIFISVVTLLLIVIWLATKSAIIDQAIAVCILSILYLDAQVVESEIITAFVIVFCLDFCFLFLKKFYWKEKIKSTNSNILFSIFRAFILILSVLEICFVGFMCCIYMVDSSWETIVTFLFSPLLLIFLYIPVLICLRIYIFICSIWLIIVYMCIISKIIQIILFWLSMISTVGGPLDSI